MGRAFAGGRLKVEDCRVGDLDAIVSVGTDPADYPQAAEVVEGVVVYSAPALAPTLADPARRVHLEDEVVHALHDGPGIVVFRGAMADRALVLAVTEAFDRIIDEEKSAGGPAGDHFGAPGANDRIWNALEKLAVRDPALFVRYYANDIIAMTSHAWLGPGYQVTSQVNRVNPGGAAQSMHRDYHLGFQSNAVAADFPAHAHRLSPVLTLQGAVAHSDMPVESGPTLFLPHSQKYLPGYLAWRLPEFEQYAAVHQVQLALDAGDIVFFNPAVHHAAGANRTPDIHRMANLLQVSSAFGRAMESVDRARISTAILQEVQQLWRAGDQQGAANVIAASAEGYAFPTNLDRDQPVDGLAPPTQADLLTAAVVEGWTADELAVRLLDRAERTRPN